MNPIANLPTGRAGRLLALALLCLVLGAGYLLLAAPLLNAYGEREQALTDKRMLAQRLATAATALPDLRAQLAELKASTNTREIMLDGNSDAIAAANLQSRLEKLASSAGATIGSTEAVPAENRGMYRRIGLRVAVGGQYAAIINLLGAIDKAAPPLVLSNLQIHAAMLRQPREASTGRLDAVFEVYGFRNAEASSPSQQ